MTSRRIRGIPLWVLREYLVELGGVARAGDQVTGPGWHARLRQLEDVRVGSLRVGEVALELSGDPDAVARLAEELEPKLLRAGG